MLKLVLANVQKLENQNGEKKPTWKIRISDLPNLYTVNKTVTVLRTVCSIDRNGGWSKACIHRKNDNFFFFFKKLPFYSQNMLFTFTSKFALKTHPDASLPFMVNSRYHSGVMRVIAFQMRRFFYVWRLLDHLVYRYTVRTICEQMAALNSVPNFVSICIPSSAMQGATYDCFCAALEHSRPITFGALTASHRTWSLLHLWNTLQVIVQNYIYLLRCVIRLREGHIDHVHS